jgi:hypothetical protein
MTKAPPLLNIVCVLRGGPEYRVEHVKALADGVARNLSLPYRFCCLTDQPAEVGAAGVEALPLTQAWPGWWAKLALFEHGLFKGLTAYFDLDTIIARPIDALLKDQTFTMCEDFYNTRAVNSSFMVWNCDLSEVYDAFAQDPDRYVREYKVIGKWGDQDFIGNHTPVKPELWQKKYPGAVVSYKANIRGHHRHPREVGNGKVPASARVICFHGLPRPWQTPLWEKYNGGT